MILFRTGERVTVTLENQTTEAVIELASQNGRSLYLSFDTMIGGYVGGMPVLWSIERAEFVELVQNRRVEIRKLEKKT